MPQDTDPQKLPTLPPPRLIARGIQAFILFSILGVVLAIWWRSPADPREVAQTLDWGIAALLLPLVGVDFLLGGLRYSLFFDGRILSRVTLWNCLRANWANIFLGAVTPCQTGGGPAQIYMLWRGGATIPEATLIAMVNFAATLVFFICSAVVALVALPPDLFGPALTPLLRLGFAVVTGATLIVLLLLLRPRVGVTLLRAVPGRRLRARVQALREGGRGASEEACRRLRSERKALLLLTCLITIVLFSNKYLIGYVIAQALHQSSPLLTFVGLHSIHYFLIYFAPTPGASGISEVSSVMLMEKIMSKESLVLYAVVWRVFTTVLGALIGGVILLLEFQQQARRERHPG